VANAPPAIRSSVFSVQQCLTVAALNNRTAEGKRKYRCSGSHDRQEGSCGIDGVDAGARNPNGARFKQRIA
jgi:hypothetical protein